MTGGAASGAGVVGEMGWGEASATAFRKGGVEGAEGVHDAEVGGDGGAAVFTDGRLIDLNNLMGKRICLHPRTGGGGGGTTFAFGQGVAEERKDTLAHEGAFSGAGDAGDDGETAKRDADGEVF